jgi:cytochrome c-type biogenesis protein CcmH
LILALWLGCAQAGVEVLSFENPQQEERYKALINELRCLVCQNQNLADSNADLAKDLRQQTYDMIQQGASDQEIADYMVARYGDFVLYRPPLRTSTLLLWVGPFLLLLAGLFMLFRVVRQRRRASMAADEVELARARQLLEGGQEDERP